MKKEHSYSIGPFSFVHCWRGDFTYLVDPSNSNIHVNIWELLQTGISRD